MPLPRTHSADASAANGVRAAGAVRAVGVGASAGGLAVIAELLAQLPANSSMAFVVVQHLDATHKAMLAELLQRNSSMRVVEAA